MDAKPMLNMIELWSDGSCIRNPGPGGYAAILIDGSSRTEVVGSNPATTNNRMELTAAIRGLQAVATDRSANIFTDSTYVLLGEKVLRTGKPYYKANKDLWLELIAVASKRTAPITWTKVKAHCGIANNESADELAKQAAAKLCA
jgi:ribonuclease HI